MTSSHYSALPIAISILLIVGCSQQKPEPENKPSYTDLVVTYNAELQTLYRLESKRKELVAEYERQQHPTPDQAVQALTDVLNSAAITGSDGTASPADPQAMLDQAVQNAEKAQQVASQMLQAATQPASPSGDGNSTQSPPYPEELQRQLTELDQEIATQRQRVERARQARDAAEQR